MWSAGGTIVRPFQSHIFKSMERINELIIYFVFCVNIYL